MKHNIRDYLMGMIDNYSMLRIDKSKIRLVVRSYCPQQILLFKQIFGGEIHSNGKFYYINHSTTKLREIIPYFGLACKLFESKKDKISSDMSINVPFSIIGCPKSYLAGKLDNYFIKGKISFIPCESDQIIINTIPHTKSKNRIIFNKKNSKLLLDILKDYMFLYNEYYSETPPTHDSTIISNKNGEYYKNLYASMRQSKINNIKSKKQEKLRIKELKIIQNKAQREQNSYISAFKIGMRMQFNEDYDNLIENEKKYEKIYLNHYIFDKKTCKKCKIRKSLSCFRIDGAKCIECSGGTYYQRNKDKIKNQIKQYQMANRDKINQSKRLSNREPNKRIRAAMRTRFKDVLEQKTEKTVELIGCSVPFLKSYLESKFKEGMNWENYGANGWHIDHIIPVSFFDLKNKEERMKCFNYKNLQPLWAKENEEKGDKMPDGRPAKVVREDKAAAILYL